MKNNTPSRKKAFLTQATGGYILTAIAMVKGLFLLPLYFKFISYDMYGYWITILSIVALLSIINFGIGVMAMQRISNAYAKKDFNTLGDYFISSVVIYIGIALAFLLLGFIVSLWLQNILNVSSEELKILKIAFHIMLLTTMLSFFSDTFRGFSISLLKPLFGIYVMVGAHLLGLCLVLVFLYNDVGILSLPISALITELIIVMFCSFYVKVLYKKFHIKSKIRYNIIKEYFTFSPHFLKLIVGNKLLENSHPILITTFLGAELTTAYDVTKKVIELILTTLNTLNGALLAPFSHLVGEGDKEKIKYNSIKIIAISFLLGVICFGTYIATNAMFVSLWISQEVVLNQGVIIALGFSALVFSMNRLFRSLLFGFDKIKFAAHSVLLEGIGYIIISSVFIGFFGIIAVPLAFLITSSFFVFKLWSKIRTLIDVKIKYQYIIKGYFMMFFIFITLIFSQMFSNELTWIGFLSHAIITTLSIIIIELLFYYQELKQLLVNKK